MSGCLLSGVRPPSAAQSNVDRPVSFILHLTIHFLYQLYSMLPVLLQNLCFFQPKTSQILARKHIPEWNAHWLREDLPLPVQDKDLPKGEVEGGTRHHHAQFALMAQLWESPSGSKPQGKPVCTLEGAQTPLYLVYTHLY